MIELLKITLIVYVFCALGEPGNIFAPYQRLIARLPDWLYNPLGGCHKCLTGQVCFWYYLITKPFNIIELLFFTSLGIFLSLLYNFIWTHFER